VWKGIESHGATKKKNFPTFRFECAKGRDIQIWRKRFFGKPVNLDA
jgi:hypothetical protein